MRMQNGGQNGGQMNRQTKAEARLVLVSLVEMGGVELRPICFWSSRIVQNPSKRAGSEGRSVHAHPGSFSGVGVKMGVKKHERPDASSGRSHQRPARQFQFDERTRESTGGGGEEG